MRKEWIPTLDDLKTRGEEALRDTRKMIGSLQQIARDSRQTVRDHRRWNGRRELTAPFAEIAKN